MDVPVYLIADKVLTDFRRQSVRSDIHTGCGPGDGGSAYVNIFLVGVK